MRAPTLETHDEFEGVGGHELNTRFDWIPEEHGDGTDDTEFDPANAGIVPSPVATPALVRALSLQLSATSPGVLHGADTSHYQVTQGGGTMNIGPGLWWWMHKASQSTGYRDPTLGYAINQMAKARIEIPGTYHWASPNTDPQQQAANWLAAVGDYRDRTVFMGDMEEAGVTVEVCLAIYEYIEARTKKPCAHYTGLYVSGGSLYRDERIRNSKYGKRPVIVAAYITRARLDSLVQSQGQGKPWHGWQFSSNGPVPSVVGRCDMDEIADKQAFLLSLTGSSAKPDPTPPTQPNTGDTDMPTMIRHQQNGWLATYEAGYMIGVEAPAEGVPVDTTGFTVLSVNDSVWNSYVVVSDAKKAADAAMAHGITVNVTGPPASTGGGPTHASGTVDLNAGTIDLTLS